MSRRTRMQASAEGLPPFDAHIRRVGLCSVCTARDSSLHHGAGFCAGNFRRQFPTCTHDGRRPRFSPDLNEISAIGATS